MHKFGCCAAGLRRRVHVGICFIARSRMVHTSSMKTVETRTRTVVRNDQFVSASTCQSDPYTGSVTQTLNERRAIIIYPFTHPCQCARFLRASTLFGSDNASKIFILLAKYLISVVLYSTKGQAARGSLSQAVEVRLQPRRGGGGTASTRRY